MRFLRLFPALLLCLLLCGCAPAAPARTCTVILEDNPGLHFTRQVFEVPRGTDFTVTVGVPLGQRIAGVSYPGAAVSARVRTVGDYAEYELTLPRVRYPAVIRLTLTEDRKTVYTLPDGSAVTVTEENSRLRVNTLPWSEACRREDSLAVGWQTEAGEEIGFGSRYTPGQDSVTALRPVFLACTPAEAFRYELRDGGAVITGCAVQGDLILPETLGGLPVTAIAAGAFGAVEADTVAFPPCLRQIEDGAFAGLSARRLYLFDTLTEVGDAAFGALSVRSLRIGAARPPVYCGSYFDTLSEKIDYLDSLRDTRKLVLFCGSSARFGYDSALLEAAFPDYRVVNLGVFAYANMLPQALLMEQYLCPGDVVLHSPELDAIDTQFCGETALDPETFAMMESNYDMLASIDLTGFTGIFDAFARYQHNRASMQPRSYSDIPAHYDEDGGYHQQLTYNRAGDYILHRESNLDRRLFGVKRACYNAAGIREADWTGITRLHDRLTARGVTVLFTYSPRSARSITPDSDEAARAGLDALLRQRLAVPVLSSIEDSLMDALYFYGTDNHLSSEGAALHTRQVIEDLRPYLEVTP